jgi:predicted nucleotidyltransferase component of viral defense system
MHTNTLPGNTGSVLQKLSQLNILHDFYLTGGTALSLQIGHRESQDLDFFTQEDFRPEEFQKELEKLGSLESVELDVGTFNCFLDEVKLQFLHYPYPLLEEKIDWEGIQISSKLDIACTKLITVSARGSKKDFIDIYFLLKEYSLPALFEKLTLKYTNSDYNEAHILKSLVYFTDADAQPMPRMHQEVSWEKVKEEIIKIAKGFRI